MNKKIINQNVIICGVVKNVENKILRSLDMCIGIGELFNDYRIIIYENNSTDNTKKILKDLNKEKVKIISETIEYDEIKKNSKIWAYTQITGSDHPCRMEQIANARNKLLNEIKKEDYNDFTYVIMIDLDTDHFNSNGIVDSFNNRDINSWDVIYANGKDVCGFYYDKFALRCYNDVFLFGTELYGDEFGLKVGNSKINFDNDENHLIPVISAFGGIGIFKKEVFNECRYASLIDESITNFYHNLLSNLPDNAIPPEIVTLFENPCNKFSGGFITTYKRNDNLYNLYWKNCSGYDKPCLCEHTYLNINLVSKGYKLFINPKLYYLHS